VPTTIFAANTQSVSGASVAELAVIPGRNTHRHRRALSFRARAIHRELCGRRVLDDCSLEVMKAMTDSLDRMHHWFADWKAAGSVTGRRSR
jgi:hypothetical protein